MSTELPSVLPPFDEGVRAALVSARDELGLDTISVSELAWAAFYRKWSVQDVDAWARTKKAPGARTAIPKGPRRPRARVNPADRWAWFRVGMLHGVIPGQVLLDDAGRVERAWLDDREVALAVYRKAVERYVREVAARYPNGELAHAIAGLETDRLRVRLGRALLSNARLVRRRPMARLARGRRRASRRRRRGGGRPVGRARDGDAPAPPPRPRGTAIRVRRTALVSIRRLALSRVGDGNESPPCSRRGNS